MVQRLLTRPTWCRSLWHWWPLVLAPLAVAGVYLAEALGRAELISKGPHEVAGVVLLSIAAAVSGVRWAVGRERFHLVLLALSVAFLCREIHFRGAHRGVYVAAGLIGAWAFAWRRPLLASLADRPRGRWLVATMWSYLLAILVQRRAFRGVLPNEAVLHSQLEEVLENVSHLLLVVVGLL